jgi:hypothetical protein
MKMKMIIKKIRLKRLQKKYEKLIKLDNPNKESITKVREKINRIVYGNKELRNARRGIFETNSSSTHALVIHSLDYKENDFERHGKIPVSTGDFDWDFGVYSTPAAKLSYILTYAYSMNDIELYLLIKDTFPNFDIQLYILNGKLEDLKEYGGYVDHANELPGDMFKDINFLKGFIFGEKNLVITGNDNDGKDIDDYIPKDASMVIRKGN